MKLKIKKINRLICSAALLLVMAFGTLQLVSVVTCLTGAQVCTAVAQKTDVEFNTNKEVECDSTKDCIDEDKNPIVRYLKQLITFVSVVAGVAIVIAVIMGGIKYTTAGGDPGKVVAAKKMIFNAIGALFAFLFLRAFLEYIRP